LMILRGRRPNHQGQHRRSQHKPMNRHFRPQPSPHGMIA
jgi:hypothetical protein